MHIRIMFENERTLCGADPREGSQSLHGIRLQRDVYFNLPAPKQEHYCPECWRLYQAAKPALEAFAHLPE